MPPDVPKKHEEMKLEEVSHLWAYEGNFLQAIDEEAGLVFDQLDPNLKPEVHIVGVSEDQGTVVVHPGVEPFTRHIFAELNRRRCHYLTQYKARHINVVGTGIPSEHYVELMALQSAIAESARNTADQLGLISFPSLPIKVGQYLVSVVLNVQAAPYNSHYSLQGRNGLSGFVGIGSLLASAIQQFLIACQDALCRPEPGHANRATERDPQELIRAAGKAMVDGSVFGLGEKDTQFRFFQPFNQLSALPYEGRNAMGYSILFAHKGHPNVAKCLAFHEPVRLHEVRAVRKLLEISSSSQGYCLLMDPFGMIFGIGKLIQGYNSIRQDLFEVRFIKHHTWELIHDDHVLMRVEYGMPQLPRPRIDIGKLESDISRRFPDIEKSSLECLKELAQHATGLNHGTILIISAKAPQEAQRLKSEGRLIEPTALSKELLGVASAIDGAILLDQTGICYAIGVILDGKASPKGTSARGSRYNSAVRYIEQHDEGAYAIVVSQDGTADLLPHLQQQVKRAEVDARVRKLRELAELTEPTVREVNRAMEWLHEHRYCLNLQYCQEINGLWRQIVSRFADKGVPRTPNATAEEELERLQRMTATIPRPWPELVVVPDWDPTSITD